MLRWGRDEPALEVWRERGLPTPALDSKPTIREDLRLVGEMYLELRRTAWIGTPRAAEPFSSSEIIEWVDLQGSCSEEDRRESVRLLMACDEVWRAWATEEARGRRVLES